MDTDSRTMTGFYCSTSGTYFTDKESLSAHYKSDFHRYNLKRKVAGLPPVTKEWFEARKEQLIESPTTGTPGSVLWVDPLTKKKFSSENTYQAYVRSKKYLDLVKKSGQPAPAPLMITKRNNDEEREEVGVNSTKSAKAGYTIKAPGGVENHQQRDIMAMESAGQRDGAEDGESDWETASNVSDMDEEVEEGAAAEWKEWDVTRSLFDNHVSDTFESNLEYMFKKFGFYLPEAEALRDPEGLLQYLGAKLQYGHVPLYVTGDDPNPKQFKSLPAVQQHMVDTNQCKMVYEGNEEEYEEYYDYAMGMEDGQGGPLALVNGSDMSSSNSRGFELVLGGEQGAAQKVLGSREFSRYYRQHHRPQDTRQSVLVNTVLAKYRSMGIETRGADLQQKAARLTKCSKKEEKAQYRNHLNLMMRSNAIRNLPKNVPY